MAPADQTSTTSDPVAQSVQSLIRLLNAYDDNDEKDFDAPEEEKHRFEERARTLSDAIAATEEQIGLRRATSFVGAMLQVMMARSDVEAIASLSPDESHLMPKYIRRIDRCLYSVIDFLSAQSGAKPDERLSDNYMRPSDNPHPFIEAVV